MNLDYKNYPILYVDDEAPNLVTFRYSLEDRFTVLTARNGWSRFADGARWKVRGRIMNE